MPQGLDSGDRKLLIAAGVLLIILVIASTLLATPEAGGRSVIPSSYSSSWSGSKAAYLLLEESGYQIERWEQPPTELEGKPENEVLILAEPMQTPSADERGALRNFLQNGGRIVATGASASRVLPEAAEFEEGFDEEDVRTFPAVAPSPVMRGAPEIKMIAPQNWQPKSPSQLIVYGDTKTAAVITYHVGRGQVIWWGASTPLTNGFIRDSGNLTLLLNSVGVSKGTHIFWDEYFHGVEGGLWNYLARTPVPWGIAQFGIVFLATLATFARRQGPIHVPAKQSRLSPLEFVETLGDLYSSGHAGSAAVRIAYQRFRFILTRQLGLAPNVPYPELVRRAKESLGWNQEELFGTLAQAERLMRSLEVRDEDARKIVQEIFDYTTRLEVRRSRKIERHSA
jgi:hypothetical protein